MSAVGVEKTATIRAQHLDRFLRRDWTLGDHLVGDRIHHRLAILAHRRLPVSPKVRHLLRLDQFGRVIRPEVLHHALRNQKQRINNAGRQQHPERGPRQVNPEIADGLFLAPRNAANERNRQRNTHRRRGKVVIRKASHLREIAHRGLAAVVLPVGIGGERRRSVESQVRSHRRELLRIQRQATAAPVRSGTAPAWRRR